MSGSVMEKPVQFKTNDELCSYLQKVDIRTQEFARYPFLIDHTSGGVIYTCLGLAGEAGEVADELKKVIRDNLTIELCGNTFLDFSPERKKNLQAELGDVFWYWCKLIRELELITDDTMFTIPAILEANIAKLEKRYDKKN